MQSIKGAQFLNITFLLLLFPAAAAAAPAIFGTVLIVPLTSMDASLYTHNLNFNFLVFNLI